MKGTIKNLRFGNLDAADEEIVAAARLDNMNPLSGRFRGLQYGDEQDQYLFGAKQLLTIARALPS